MAMDSEPKIGLPGKARSQVDVVRALVRGESVTVIDPKGETAELLAELARKDEGNEGR